MTDVLDRPVTGGPEGRAPGDDPSPSAPRADDSAAGAHARAGAEHWLLAALLLGAGVIHHAMAPSHLGESAVEGAGFLVSAWLQIFLAAAVVLRPGRRLLAAVAVVNLAMIAAWAVSRTAGLPFGAHSGHPESVSLVDGVCVGLEAVAVLLAVGMLAGLAASTRGVRWMALVGAVGAVAFATAAVASPAARDHASGSHGDHGGAAAGEDDLGFSLLSNGHQHDAAEVAALTPEETAKLARELATTAELVEKFPTIADAEAAGWRRAGPFSPGLGTHYLGPDFGMNRDGDMDREDLLTPVLVYDGLEPDAALAGFMYMGYGDTAPEGFTGPNDTWHYHEKVCITQGEDGAVETPFGADLEGVTEAMCTEVGGSWIDFTGYMVHVWNVPGYESPDGMFTELNPAVTCPDGTYFRIPVEELGLKDSICQNP